MGYTPTAPYNLTTYSVSTSSTAAFDYKTAIDDNFIVMQRLGTLFAVSEQPLSSARDMTVRVAAGWLYNGNSFTEVAAQDSTAIAVPSVLSRIDRIVANIYTGAMSIVSGTEALSPAAPTIPANSMPLASLTLEPRTTAIGNSMLTDERAYWGLPGVIDYQVFTSTAFTWNRPAFTTDAMVTLQMWGPGGGGSAYSGGGGGAFLEAKLPLGSLSTSVSGSVGAGGTTAGSTAGITTFGSFTIYGGGPGSSDGGGGGGGVLGPGSSSGLGGNPTGSTVGSGSAVANDYGGGGGTLTTSASPGQGGVAVLGGGGGAGGKTSTGAGGVGFGGDTVKGGGGGGGASQATTGGRGGVSQYGGSGGTGSTSIGSAGSPGSAPGGGGGAGAPGARGEVRVWVTRG